ncbi:hypothetical protein Tco_1419240, partial [Tanacetum coccineum]
KKKVIITETSIRSDLQLEDAEVTECLPNATIFKQLTLMSAKTTAWNEFSSTMASTCSWINKLKEPRRKQSKGTEVYQLSGPTEPITDEAANKEHEKVKKLERRNKSRNPRLKRLRKVGRTVRIESFEDEGLGDQEDASKQGRKIADLDVDIEVALVDEAQGRNDDNLMFDIGVLDEQEVKVEMVVSTAEVTTTIATTTTVDELTLAQTLIEIKATKPKAVTTAATTTTTVVIRPKAREVVVQEPSEFTITTSP